MTQVNFITVDFVDGGKVVMDPDGCSPHVWPAPGEDMDTYIKTARTHCGLNDDPDDEEGDE